MPEIWKLLYPSEITEIKNVFLKQIICYNIYEKNIPLGEKITQYRERKREKIQKPVGHSAVTRSLNS